MPEASDRSVTSVSRPAAPDRRHVSQSWGSATAATRSADSGSASRSQRSFVTVSDATGTDPTADAHSWAPSSSVRSAAAPAERVSFQSSASRTTEPDESSATSPCCWPPTERAATSSRPPAWASADCSASHQCRGSTDVPSGCGARPLRTSAPVSTSRMTTLQACVEESTPATSVMTIPSRNARAAARTERVAHPPRRVRRAGAPRRPHPRGQGPGVRTSWVLRRDARLEAQARVTSARAEGVLDAPAG